MNTTTAATMYRVVATTRTGFTDERVDVSFPWTGTDIDELSRLYPPSDIFGADPLFHHEIEDGFIRTDYKFEQKLFNGSWVEIHDPRRRLTPMTALERAIDAENRRDFPGDYITEDCTACGDYGCPECDGDPYGPDCTKCNDDGCDKCMNCIDCHDYGCAKCDPDNVCIDCKLYEPLDNNRRCDGCAYEATIRYCSDCQEPLPDTAEGDLCGSCTYDKEHPLCVDNCSERADGDDGLCSGCRDYYTNQVCTDCGYALREEDSTLCGQCKQHELELKQYNAWWRRVLRKVMFWR